MRMLTCLECDLPITIPACGAAVTKATLTRELCTTIVLDIYSSAVNPDGSTTTILRMPVTTPATKPPARGVWRLNLTACRCYSSAIFVDACPAPAFPATSAVSRPSLGPFPVHCLPDAQPDLTTLPATFLFQSALDAEHTIVGIHTAGLTPYGALLAPEPTPAPTSVSITTPTAPTNSLYQLDGELAGATLPDGTRYTLFDSDGYLVASGALTAQAFTAVLDAPLGCGVYALTLEAPTP